MTKELHDQSYQQRLEEWRQKTTAKIIDVVTFEAIKEREQLYVVGVAGFSGSWRHAGLEKDALETMLADMRDILVAQLTRLKGLHGDKLMIASGATNKGVLELTYRLCEELHIQAMGVTSDRGLEHEVGTMKYLLPIGREWGEESSAFVSLSDEFIIIGGGKQAKGEVEAAAQAGKRVSVVRGFGGVADALTEAEMPGGSFIQGRSISR